MGSNHAPTASWRRTLGLLAGSQALSQSLSVFVMTLSSVTGAALAPDPAWASWPVAAVILGTFTGLFPLAWLMARRGRRWGFGLSAALGALGAAASMGGLAAGSFELFTLGHLFIGLQQAGFQYLRFAAAETVPEAQTARALSLVLGGGVVAAFLGPWLAHFARSAGLDLPWGLAYGPLAALYALLALLLVLLPRLETSSEAPAVPPAPAGPGRAELSAADAASLASPPRSSLDLLTQPVFLKSVLGSSAGYALMILLMTATPLAMGHEGHASHEVSWVIQWHVLGMFVPSFFTGSLIRRWGLKPVLSLGLAALGLEVLTALWVQGIWSYWGSLMLLGLGWNFLYVGSSHRLTGTYRPAEKERVQAAHDIAVFSLNTLATYGAAGLLGALGWQGLHLWTLPLIALTALGILWPEKRF